MQYGNYKADLNPVEYNYAIIFCIKEIKNRLNNSRNIIPPSAEVVICPLEADPEDCCLWLFFRYEAFGRFQFQ